MSVGQALPVLYVVGTHYEVGYNIGSTFAERIRSFWNESEDIHTMDVPFSKTPAGKAYFESALEVCKNNFPQYVSEGISDGAGMPFDNIFMLNITKEIPNELADDSLQQLNATETAGCTDVLINSSTCKIIGHNEDCDPISKLYDYFVSATILDENRKEVESFTAHCYPGFLAGATLSFNKYGIVFSIDFLYNNFIVHGAPSRIFLTRSMIKARTFEEAIDLIENKNYGVSYGFTVNIADVKSPTKMWSVEVCPQAEISMIHIQTVSEVSDPHKNCHYIHTNTCQHLKTSEILDLNSSLARSKRAEEEILTLMHMNSVSFSWERLISQAEKVFLIAVKIPPLGRFCLFCLMISYPLRENLCALFPPPKSRDDVLAILGDQTNEEYPIYRTVRPTDNFLTSFTSIVDILRNRVDIYVENPSLEHVLPLLHFSIMDK